MLLFDDSKKLEKALGEEAAAIVVHVFEKMDADYKRELATKADLLMVKAELEAEITNTRSELKADIEKLELRLKHDLTLRLGGMMAASIAIVAALVKLL